MVDSGDPLAHAIIVLVFSPECDLEKCPGKNSGRPLAPQTAVAADLAESGVPVVDQPQAVIIIRENAAFDDRRIRGTKDRLHQVVVEIRRPGRKLGLLQREKPPMVPRHLSEGYERSRVFLKKPIVGFPRLSKVPEQPRIEQVWCGFGRLERHHPTEYLAAVVSRHSHRGNLRSALIRVENRGTAYVRASVCEVYGPFRVLSKAREEILPHGDYFVGLTAELGHLPRDEHILGL